MMTHKEINNIEICSKLKEVINDKKYELIDEIMAPDFKDHHPGIGENVTSREAYKQALMYVHEALDMKVEVDVSFSKEDRVVTRVTMTGKHRGIFLGVKPTGKEIKWTTIEMYKIENNKIKERSAIDDMFGLLQQIGYDFKKEGV